MGLFDLFSKGSGKKGEKGEKKSNPASKYAEKAGDKRAQNYDRQEAIQNLADLGTVESAAALLKRFTFMIDPSITDQEEKEAAFNGILRAGNKEWPAPTSVLGIPFTAIGVAEVAGAEPVTLRGGFTTSGGHDHLSPPRR